MRVQWYPCLVFGLTAALLGWEAQADSNCQYYTVLGVSPSATQREIKSAYRKLSIKYHPDKNPNDADAAGKFSELAEAYGVLSDEETRRRCDRFGKEGLNGHGGGSGGADPFDIFAQFFGGGGGGGSFFGFEQEQQETRGPDLHIPLEVTLAELYMGHTIEYDVSKQVLCEHCHGSGAESPDDITTCTSCKGQGIKVVQQMLMPGFYQTMQSPCDVCSGTGKVIGTKCSRCHGNKVERANEPLTVEIAAGMPDRHRIAFERHADHSPEWDVPGSVVFHLRTRPHPRFTRDGNDLHLNYTISLLQALSGFETSFTHLDKTTRVDLKRPNVVTPPGFVQKVKGQGMPLFDEHAGLFTEGAGDLYVHYIVEFPESVSSANRVILKTVLSATVRASNAIHDEL